MQILDIIVHLSRILGKAKQNKTSSTKKQSKTKSEQGWAWEQQKQEWSQTPV